jgi:hypothetical protein
MIGDGSWLNLIEGFFSKVHRSARSTGYRWLCGTWTRPAPDSGGKRKSWWTADNAQKDRRRRLRNALPIEKASGGTGVRTDQTGTRFPPVPVARRRESTCRVGHDLHHPQPPEAVRPQNEDPVPFTARTFWAVLGVADGALQQRAAQQLASDWQLAQELLACSKGSRRAHAASATA